MAARHETLREVLNLTARGMLRSGAIDRSAYEQIVGLGVQESERAITVPVPSASEIRAMRAKANLSQAEFAQRLQLSAGYISQLERGVKTPTGATVVLLNLIRKRGIDAIS